jgi:hypothetical protein
MMDRKAARRVAAGGALILATLVPAMAATASPAFANTGRTCSVGSDKGPWPAGGVPMISSESAPGYYIYHFGIWHVRVVGPSGTNFSGVITSSGWFAPPFHLNGATVTRAPAGGTLRFSLTTDSSGINGLDFSTRCMDGMQYHLQMNGTSVPPSQVWLGKAMLNPASQPFTLHRL